MKKNFLYFLLTILIFSIVEKSSAQSIDQINNFNTDKVKNLSDNELKKLIKKAEAQGYDESYIESIARLKGVSEADIDLIRERVKSLKTQKKTSHKASKIEKINTSKPRKITNTASEYYIFGSEIFNNPKLSFQPSHNIPTPTNYELGIGDEVIIDIWGASQSNYHLSINKSGHINIDNVGPIHLNGLTINQAEKRLINRLSEIYEGLRGKKKNTYALLTLGKLKSIKVNMVGEVVVPGTYNLPSLSSAFNALYMAGGLNKNGSYRNIEVVRNNKIVATLDVYDFLIKGTSPKNIYLKDQDIIKVNVFKNKVKVEGAFVKNGIFELKENETVNSLLQFVGGFSDDAYQHKIDIERNGEEHKIFHSVKDQDFQNFTLENGDVVKAKVIDNKIDNRVSINGAVVREGFYEFEDGLSLKKLLNKAKGLEEDAYLKRAIIIREKEDLTKEMIAFPLGNLLKSEHKDIKLRINDNIWINSISDMKVEEFVSVSGEIVSPNTHDYVEGMTLKDILLLSGGFTDAASTSRIEVSRRVKGTEATGEVAKTYMIDLKDGLAVKDENRNFKLEPFDQIFVRKKAFYQKQQNVGIHGEIMFSGKYTLSSEEEKISDLIKRAGGLKKNAYIDGVRLIRKTSEGQAYNVSIDLQKILDDNRCSDNLILKKGDKLIIPKTEQVVLVKGAVQNSNAIAFKKTNNFIDYVQESGGFNSNAHKSKAYVKYLDGRTDVTHSFLGIKSYPKIEPGAKIIVPNKPVKSKKSPQFWVGISTSIASMALIITTIITTSKSK